VYTVSERDATFLGDGTCATGIANANFLWVNTPLNPRTGAVMVLCGYVVGVQRLRFHHPVKTPGKNFKPRRKS
jgi:hypothetical protein